MEEGLVQRDKSVIQTYQGVSIDLATQWIKSNMLPTSIKTPEQAILVSTKGQELGLKPLESFEFIDVIMNKPTLKP